MAAAACVAASAAAAVTLFPQQNRAAVIAAAACLLAAGVILAWGWRRRWVPDNLFWDTTPYWREESKQGVTHLVRAVDHSIQPVHLRLAFAKRIRRADIAVRVARDRDEARHTSISSRRYLAHERSPEPEWRVRRKKLYIDFDQPALTAATWVEVDMFGVMTPEELRGDHGLVVIAAPKLRSVRRRE